MSSPSSRRNKDIMKLMMSKHNVTMIENESARGKPSFRVDFLGPSDTPYAGGLFFVHVELPDEYPFKSPSIGFLNKIFHPNIDENSGSVCLDVINQTWSPMYELTNVFERFLPHLLRYPNPSDPLNGEAASMLINDPDEFARVVKEYVALHASSESKKAHVDEAVCSRDGGEAEALSDLSDLSDDDDEQVTGKMEM